jgi:hypothetical protein
MVENDIKTILAKPMSVRIIVDWSPITVYSTCNKPNVKVAAVPVANYTDTLTIAANLQITQQCRQHRSCKTPTAIIK